MPKPPADAAPDCPWKSGDGPPPEPLVRQKLEDALEQALPTEQESGAWTEQAQQAQRREPLAQALALQESKAA